MPPNESTKNTVITPPKEAKVKDASRATDKDYSSAWAGRRTPSKPELKQDIKHA